MIVMKLIAYNVGKNHVIYVQLVLSPYLFYNHLQDSGTTGMCRPGSKGFLPGFVKIKLPKEGDGCAAKYDDEIVSLQIHDLKL